MRTRPPLMSIKVGGPFERVGVDILEMPLTESGNCYVVIFMDCLTKWVEAFPLPDQASESIARLLVDHVICRRGVPKVLLSDRGANLLPALMKRVCVLTGMQKENTTAAHPQTSGLVENFNKTLHSMLAKHGCIQLLVATGTYTCSSFCLHIELSRIRQLVNPPSLCCTV